MRKIGLVVTEGNVCECEILFGTIFHNVKMPFGRHVKSGVQNVNLRFLSDTGK